MAAEPNESRKVAKFLKKTVTKYDFATGSSRPLFQPNLTKTLKRRRRHEAFGSTATDVSAFSLNLAQKGTEKHALKNHTMQLFFKNLCNFPWCIWLGSHRCFSVLAKPFFTTGFWGWQQHLQRDLNKNGRKIKKVRFFDKTGRRQNRPFSRAEDQIRCKFHQNPL